MKKNLLPPGTCIKFQARLNESQHGYSWKVNTHKTKSDIYVENSYAKDPIHISHHASGRWHIAFPDESKEGGKKVYRAVSNDRAEIVPGWQHASRIVIFKADAVLCEEDDTAIQVPFHSESSGICIDIYLGEANAINIQISNGFLIAEMLLADDRLAVIFARPYESDTSPQEAFSEIVNNARIVLANNGWDGSMTSIVVLCDSDEKFGFIQQVEMRISKP